MNSLKNKDSSNQIKYCQKCVMPFTKPDLEFYDKNICSACYFFEKRKEIDWEERKEKFHDIFKKKKRCYKGYIVVPAMLESVIPGQTVIVEKIISYLKVKNLDI